MVGATTPDGEEPTARRRAGGPGGPRRRPGGARGVPSRRAFRLVSFLAVLGLVGTLVFGDPLRDEEQ